jgi:hypothetical protein
VAGAERSASVSHLWMGLCGWWEDPQLSGRYLLFPMPLPVPGLSRMLLGEPFPTRDTSRQPPTASGFVLAVIGGFTGGGAKV